MAKQLSCGVLVTHKNSLLLCHVTGTYNRWDIPKGMPNDGEDHVAAAIRELNEETGIVLGANYRELGYTEYTKTKDLFLLHHEGLYEVSDMTCLSFFEDDRPEMDGFKYFDFNQIVGHVTPNLYKVLTKFLG